MRKVYIFGDSFSATLRQTPKVSPYPNADLYVKAEKSRGNEAVKDLNYWFQEELSCTSSNILNKARGGNSNDQIFNDFYFNYPNIEENDIIYFQLSKNTRMMVLDYTYKKWHNVHFNTLDLNSTEGEFTHNIVEFNSRSFISYQDLMKFAVMRTTAAWEELLINQVVAAQKSVELIGAHFVCTSLDNASEHLQNRMTFPFIFQNNKYESIEDIFPKIADKHPTYEAYRNIVNKIITVTNTKK